MTFRCPFRPRTGTARLPSEILSPRRSPGFTLIEVLVVLVIAGVLFSVLVLSFGAVGNDRDLQRDARRLGSLLELAGEEAELQGRDFGVEFIRNGYRFVEYDPIFERWGDILGDDILRVRTMSEGTEIELFIEDRRIELADEVADTGSADDEDDGPLLDKYAPHGLLMSSGDLSPMVIDVVRRTDDARYRITIDVDSSIEVVAQEDGFD